MFPIKPEPQSQRPPPNATLQWGCTLGADKLTIGNPCRRAVPRALRESGSRCFGTSPTVQRTCNLRTTQRPGSAPASPPYPSLARQVRAFFRLYAHALAPTDCHLIRLCRWVSIQDQGSRMHAISEKQNEQIRTRSCSKRAGASVHPLVRREHQRMAIRFSKLCALLRRREEVPQMVGTQRRVARASQQPKS